MTRRNRPAPSPSPASVQPLEPSPWTDEAIRQFHEGRHYRLYDVLGSHPQGEAGTQFAVWAPNAASVSVIGDFNDWDKTAHPLYARPDAGVWEGRIPEAYEGHRYKYHIVSDVTDYRVDKADPVGFTREEPPQTASIIASLDYEWGDADWLAERGDRQKLDAPLAIYEVHLGSWLRDPATNAMLGYREIAPKLADYVDRMGFTHVELMPVAEHPFYGSWGYQITGYFAPTRRYGTPQDLMHLIDHLHQRGIGVILDWVPSHFPTDEHGLSYFDGTHLYEYEDPHKGFHPDWNSFIFDYGRNEVVSFLTSNARFWLDRYHVDGLRVDGVASMLYLNYSRNEGEWVPNEYGGQENLEAIAFLRRVNEAVFEAHPDVQTIAEESTAWPMVSRPTYVGGLGFGLKWDMGWMHDTLGYMREDPIHRTYHHDALTFRMVYAFNENFVLPLSHDEVVHGKHSLLNKMPGDEWQQFANLRLLYGYMYAQPGKKLLFMGGEFAQSREWHHDRGLDWHLLQDPRHEGVQRWLATLNHLYRQEPALHAQDCDEAGFAWIDNSDSANSVISFLRRGGEPDPDVLVVGNFTPVPRPNYRVGVPWPGSWRELANSDAADYGGAGYGNLGGAETTPVPYHGQRQSLNLVLPPLGVLFLRWEGTT